MTSSCSKAAAWKNSIAVAARITASVSGPPPRGNPVEEGRPEPFSSSQQCADRRHQRGELFADLGQDPRLRGDFGVNCGLHACGQSLVSSG